MLIFWALLEVSEQRKCRKSLKEVHEEEFGNHTGGRSITLKILRLRYYESMIRKDLVEMAQRWE